MQTVQQDVNNSMRSILVDWLVEVAQEYKLVSETLFLAINYIDRFLSSEVAPRRKLQLVGITCMLVAAKYEEIYAPQIEDFCYITDNTYTRDEVLAMEQQVTQLITCPPVMLDALERTAFYIALHTPLPGLCSVAVIPSGMQSIYSMMWLSILAALIYACILRFATFVAWLNNTMCLRCLELCPLS